MKTAKRLALFLLLVLGLTACGTVPGGAGALSAEFRIGDGANQFSNVFPIQ